MTVAAWHALLADLTPCGHGEEATVCNSSPLMLVCGCGLSFKPIVIPCPGCGGSIDVVDRVGGTADCVCGFRAPHYVKPRVGRVNKDNKWKRRRRQAFDRDGGRCRGCSASLAADAFEVDHIVPRAAGGGHDLANLQILCAGCHARKTAVDHARGVTGRRGAR